MGGRRELIIAVSRCPHSYVRGEFQRHASMGAGALAGSQGGGRWGPPNTFSVLYLGRPRDSIIVEAYRHLVDPFEGMTADDVQPRKYVTVQVDVTDVLDLTVDGAAASLGLATADLESSVGDYDTCWEVARAAHQLGLHGVLAPAATGLGDTLALFEEHLPSAEMPQPVREDVWERLPADPRALRVVRDELES